MNVSDISISIESKNLNEKWRVATKTGTILFKPKDSNLVQKQLYKRGSFYFEKHTEAEKRPASERFPGDLALDYLKEKRRNTGRSQGP